MANLIQVQNQLAKAINEYDQAVEQNGERDKFWRSQLTKLIGYVEKIGGEVQYNKQVVTSADQLMSLVSKQKVSRKTGKVVDGFDPKFDYYIGQYQLFVPIYGQLESQLEQYSEQYRQNHSQKLYDQLEQILEHLSTIRGYITDIVIALGSVLRFETNVKPYVKKIDRLKEKVSNINQHAKDKLPQALEQVVTMYQKIYYNQIVATCNEVRQIVNQCNGDVQKIVKMMNASYIPLFYTMYLNKEDSELQQEAEYYATILVYNMYNRVVEYVGEVKKVEDVVINDNGDMTATVYGEAKGAYMQTIIAGGYNIQREHYRILVHPFNIKED